MIFKISSWPWWRFCWASQNYAGIFGNRPGVIGGRWGFYILGLEIGSREPGNGFGLWLKNHGLWPW
jgi:hypothetical protein